MYMIDDHSPLVLPKKYDEMNKFIENNKVKLTEHIVSSIEYALKNQYPVIEVFNFQNTEFSIILKESSFKSNIESIFQFYIEGELYEFCDRVNKIKELLSHEKKTKRTTKKRVNGKKRQKSSRAPK